MFKIKNLNFFKKIFSFFLLFSLNFILTSCDGKDFASPKDLANVKFIYDVGSTRYIEDSDNVLDSFEELERIGKTNFYRVNTSKTCKRKRFFDVNNNIDDINIMGEYKFYELKLVKIQNSNVYKFQNLTGIENITNIIDYTDDFEIGISPFLKLERIKGTKIFQLQDFNIDYKEEENLIFKKIFSVTTENNIVVPSNNYWFELDKKILQKAWKKEYGDGTSIEKEDLKVSEIIKCLNNYGYIKFLQEEKEEKNIKKEESSLEKWNEELINTRILTIDDLPNQDFKKVHDKILGDFVNVVNSYVSLKNGEYGNFGPNHNKVKIEGKSFSFIMSKHPISGLFIYPITFLIETFTNFINANGWGQVLAIFLVVLIINILLFLLFIQSSIENYKKNLIQPEIYKIQEKYPNYKTDNDQRRFMILEQRMLYKKYHVRTYLIFLAQFIRLFLFILMFPAFRYSAILSNGVIFNLFLNNSILNTLSNTNGLWQNTNGWWTALVLFILTVGVQILSAKLPQWLQQRMNMNNRKFEMLKKSEQQMSLMMTIVLLIITIIVDLNFPVSMGIYTLVSSIISIIINVIVHFAILPHMIKKRVEKNESI